MKTLTNNSFTPLNSEQLKKLTRLVAETIAIDANACIGKTFTSADLWNIQRAKKSVRNRRFI
jgi:hypothetical protein